MSTVFVGHFSPLNSAMKAASSAAGNQVQRQILKEFWLLSCAGAMVSYSMEPLPCWPRGPISTQSVVEGSVTFIGYVNLPALKHFVFAFRLFFLLLEARPEICLQYNSYLFENIALLLLRLCRSSCVLAMFIQDIHVSSQVPILSKRALRSFSEWASIRLARRFDIIVPISEAIIDDFHLNRGKSFVFQGGVTDFAEKLMKQSEQQPLLDIAVFAGALEPHNGIDRLVDQWVASKIEWPLHVFGRGSLLEHVKLAASNSEKIVLHDFQPEHIVLDWQSKARWNFCLRYSIGINQRYFFPSKLFNIACAPGAVLANDFYGLPASLRKHINILSEDLSNLPASLAATSKCIVQEDAKMRHKIIMEQFSWKACIAKILEMKIER